jgi:hypothetical protein
MMKSVERDEDGEGEAEPGSGPSYSEVLISLK